MAHGEGFTMWWGHGRSKVPGGGLALACYLRTRCYAVLQYRGKYAKQVGAEVEVGASVRPSNEVAFMIVERADGDLNGKVC
jgi:triosephosphate isomerase